MTTHFSAHAAVSQHDEPFQRFIAAARPSAALWRLLVGVCVFSVLAFVLPAVWVFFLFSAIYFWHDWVQHLFSVLPMLDGLVASVIQWITPAIIMLSPIISVFMDMVEGIDPRFWGVAGVFASFLFWWGALAVVVIVVHKRSLRSVYSPPAFKIRDGLQQCVPVALILSGIIGVSFVVSFLFGTLPVLRNIEWLPWLVFVLVMIPLIIMQSTAEEMVFRGYLQQQLAVRFRSAWVWMVLPSAVFAALHYDSEAVFNSYALILSVFIFALVMADVTRLSGSLMPAMFLHSINNILAVLVISLPDDLGAVTLYWVDVESMTYEQLEFLWLTDTLAFVIFWVLWRLYYANPRAARTSRA